MYYKETKTNCQALLEKMDTKYGYPNSETKTNTIIAIVCIAIGAILAHLCNLLGIITTI